MNTTPEDSNHSVGDGLNANRGNWSFKGEVAQNFDEHVSRSVPLYNEGHDLICDLSDFFVKSGSSCYEIGSSTGTLTFKLAAHNAGKDDCSFIGIDIEEDMVSKANEKAVEAAKTNVSFISEDALSVEIQKADMIVCYYTLQFIRPSLRQLLVDKLYDSLNWGGALIVFEKVRGADARFQDVLTALYTDYKIRRGYSAEEILGKSRSLKGILEPFSTQGNLDMLRRAGFVDINTIQKYLCFEGFLAIK